jgi:hypothetical protein
MSALSIVSRIKIIAEPDRGDVVDRDFDVIRGEIAQRGRHHAHEAVEDHLEHGQTFIRDERGIDDGANTGAFRSAAVILAKAKEAIDFVLVENSGRAGDILVRRSPIAARSAFGRRRCRVAFRGSAACGCRPFGGHFILISLILFVGHNSGAASLDQHLFEKNLMHLDGCDSDVDACQQFLAQTIDALGAA